MYKKDVLAHFGNQVAVAKAIGRTKSAVSQWPDIIPIDAAIRIEQATGGILKLDLAYYPTEKKAG